MKSNKDRGAYFALFADPALSVGFLLKRLRRLDDGHGHVVVGFIVDRRSRGVGRGNLCHCCWTYRREGGMIISHADTQSGDIPSRCSIIAVFSVS